MDRSYPLFLFYFLWREPAISELFINEQIRDKEIRLIGESGEQLGIMSSREALKLAEEAIRHIKEGGFEQVWIW